MAFILKKTASIKWPVVIKKASDGGKFKEHKFDAVFKEIGRDRFNKLIDEGDEALTDEILLGWEKFKMKKVLIFLLMRKTKKHF